MIKTQEFNGDKTKLKGAVLHMPDTFYHTTDGFISSSGLAAMLRSPAHYFHSEITRTRNMEIGSAIHTSILEPEHYKEKYITVSATDRRASVYKEAAKIHGGEFTLTKPESDMIAIMTENVRMNAAAEHMLKTAKHREVSVFTTDPETGVGVRIRADLLNISNSPSECFIADYKSTTDAREWNFSRSINDYSYHIQAALYLSAIEWEFGVKLDNFYLIVQEKTAPYLTEVYQLDDISLAIGKKLMREMLNKYAECVKTQNWPGYDGAGEIKIITLPEYVIGQFEDENQLIIGA